MAHCNRREGGRMTTAVTPRGRTDEAKVDDTQRPADVFVIFGITGDLAKQMTFRSLYRLERRGLLGCPIVGVAVDDWTLDDLRERARSSYVAGDFADGDTFERLAAAIPHARSPVFYLEIPPFLFGTVIKGLAGA